MRWILAPFDQSSGFAVCAVDSRGKRRHLLWKQILASSSHLPSCPCTVMESNNSQVFTAEWTGQDIFLLYLHFFWGGGMFNLLIFFLFFSLVTFNDFMGFSWTVLSCVIYSFFCSKSIFLSKAKLCLPWAEYSSMGGVFSYNKGVFKMWFTWSSRLLRKAKTQLVGFLCDPEFISHEA